MEDAFHIASDRWRLMGKRWIFPVILVVLAAGGIAAWIRTDSARTVNARSPSASGANDGTCVLSEPPDSSTGKNAFADVARVGKVVLATGTRYIGSRSVPLAGYEGSQGWATDAIRGFDPHSSLDGVTADQVGGAWAVGVSGRIPAIARWDGRSWTELPSPDPGGPLNVLSGVDAVSPRLAWAVGRHDDGFAYRTLIERWDGTTWQIVPSPDVGSKPNTLRDVAVAGPDDAWAVGWRIAGLHYRTLAQHWDGSSWSVVPTPDLGPGDAVLTGVAAVSPQDVWSVGWVTRDDVLRPVVERWNGSRWASAAPPSGIGPAAFSAVTPTPHGVAVVGRRLVDQKPQAFAMIRDSGGWHAVTIETGPSLQAWLNSVAVDASGTLWAVGSRLTSDGLFASLVVRGCVGS